jgi:hypothetical protein
LSPDYAPLSGSDTGLMSPSVCALVLVLSVPALTLTIGRSNDTKFVAIGVRHDYVIGMGSVLPRQPGGTERLQPGDFRPLILRIEIEMQAVPPDLRGILPLEGDIGPTASGVREHDEGGRGVTDNVA